MNVCGVVEVPGESGGCMDQQVHAFGCGAEDRHRGLQSQDTREDPCVGVGDMGNLSVVPVEAEGIAEEELEERTGRQRTRSDFRDH